MLKDYNTQKESLILKEYGRNVQKLVKYISTLQDKDERTRAAHTLINLMKQLNPSVREHNDNAQRIWDHLYHMSDFQLDIDSPYPVPEPGELYQKPQKLGYNIRQLKFKHYGRNIELLVEKALQTTDPAERLGAVMYIVRLMKTFYSAWNKENIDDEVILEHINILSEGKINLTSADLRREHDSSRDNRGENRENRDGRENRDNRENRENRHKQPGMQNRPQNNNMNNNNTNNNNPDRRRPNNNNPNNNNNNDKRKK